MQNPSSHLAQQLQNQVTKEWTVFSDKNIIIYQHLEPLDKAQEKLSLLIAQTTTNLPMSERVKTTTEFLTYFMKIVLKTRIKMEKYQTKQLDLNFTKTLDEVIRRITNQEWNSISLLNYTQILFHIGNIYERLGYSSAERIRTRTPFQSEMEVPGVESAPEVMENAPLDFPVDFVKQMNSEDSIG